VEFVNQLNPASVYNSGGVKTFFFCLCCTGECSENSEMKIVFIILLEVLQQK
jgi:hypothetical protein